MIAIRKGSRRVELRAEATGHFEAILQAVAAGQKYAELDRVCFALGNQYGEDPQRRQDAIKMYRQGLALNPLSAVGHNSLGQHLLQSRQVLGAMGEFKVAIQLDPDLNPAYANLAKLFLRHVKPTELEQEYQHIAEEFEESAAQVLSRLSLEMVELGKEQVYEGWVKEYEETIEAYITCRFLQELGPGQTHPELALLVQVHDMMSRSDVDPESVLGLA